AYKDIELNIMPFIDIFSMLNTFLLFTAVFLSMGILEVQIPFLSSTPPPDDPKQAREFKVAVDVTKEQVEIQTSFSMPPEQAQKFQFPLNKDGLQQMHTKLAQIRKDNPDNDKATVYSDDEVIWDNLSQVLDSVMIRGEKDPVFAVPKDALKGKEKDSKAREKAELLTKIYVYPKVVMGSVMLK
ncbi:MAG: biopolymer transporter ExbD, partial [Proteobacteria bacterium]|nr:biopolymer transporter ExbD [Pseudomonadota bacterium]